MSAAEEIRQAADRLTSGDIHLWATVANTDGTELGRNVAPEVGAWLDGVAKRIECKGAHALIAPTDRPAFTVARAINGGAR